MPEAAPCDTRWVLWVFRALGALGWIGGHQAEVISLIHNLPHAHSTAALIRYMAPLKNKTGVNLLSSEGGPVTTPKVRSRARRAGDGAPLLRCRGRRAWRCATE